MSRFLSVSMVYFPPKINEDMKKLFFINIKTLHILVFSFILRKEVLHLGQICFYFQLLVNNAFFDPQKRRCLGVLPKKHIIILACPHLLYILTLFV